MPYTRYLATRLSQNESMTIGPSMISTTKAAYIAHSMRALVSIGLATFQGEQALRLENDDRDHDAEHHSARQDVVGRGRDQAVDLAEDAGREHRAEQAADAAHHDDEEAVDHHRRAHVGKYRLQAPHHHASDAGKARSEREGECIDARHVDAAGGCHLRVADDGTHLRAHGGAVDDEPRREREDRGDHDDEEAVAVDA